MNRAETLAELRRFKTYVGQDTPDGTGPQSSILTVVHGNEGNGKKAMDRLKKRGVFDRLEQGRIIAGQGHPEAYLLGLRQLEGGPNLNRMFKDAVELTPADRSSGEFARAQEIKAEALDRTDVLLDVHGTRNPITVPHIIAEANAGELVGAMPFDVAVSGFDEFEPGGTDYYMNKKDKIGVCVEAGYVDDPETVDRSEEAILAFLQARGHISGEEVRRMKKYFRLFYMHSTVTDFTRAKTFRDFEPVEKDQVLGTDGENPVTSAKEGIILFASKDYTAPKQEAFLLAEPTPTLV